ncbi:MAG: hypothetical protein IE909_02650 [Campylobacterales bacterium]|nr:hypothetical protein [Campylobacterales bacterium]
MNKILLFIIAILGGVVVLNLLTTKEIEKVDTVSLQTNEKQEAIKNQKDIQILYLDGSKPAQTTVDTKPKTSMTHTTIQPTVQPIQETTTVKPIDEQLVLFSTNPEKFNGASKESFHATIQASGLVQINTKKDSTELGGINIFANISKEDAVKKRDSMSPPSTPVFYTTTTSNGNTITAVIDGEVFKQADTIVIADTNPDGSVDGVAVVTKPQNEIQSDQSRKQEKTYTLIAPPSIGQNSN